MPQRKQLPPDTIDGTYTVVGEKPKREPILGPWRNVLVFVVIFGLIYLSSISKALVKHPEVMPWIPRIHIDGLEPR